uniref:Uncharacterized protein n=1 Tax=Steinernema glaseri TaxID=37863 RepID=A0A1I7ZYW5_9BILA
MMFGYIQVVLLVVLFLSLSESFFVPSSTLESGRNKRQAASRTEERFNDWAEKEFKAEAAEAKDALKKRLEREGVANIIARLNGRK